MPKRFMLPLVALLALAACNDETPLVGAGGAAANASAASLPQVLEVKFREPLRVRSEAGALQSETGASLAEVAALLARYGVTDVQPLFRASAASIEQIQQAAVQLTGQAAPDLRSWYHLTVPAGVSAEEVLARLQATPEVAHAYRAPVPAPPPGQFSFATPDFSSAQGYFGPAPAGTDAVYARTLPGGRGDGVTVVDLEYDWYFWHEDLGLTDAILLAGERYTYYGSDHGTAVLGELVARDNGFGVTGGVPNATIRVASTVFPGGWYRPADAIAAVTAATSPGDVLLLEQQTTGPNGPYVPLEWVQSVFDATLAATMAGRIVVAAAGNGGQNLDGPEFLGRFDRGVRNSGAIIVGAGNSLHARLAFSCYGSRIDLQGWGGSVTTTGYGWLYGSSLMDYYTSGFSGTSSASPIVTAAVAAVQGRRKARGQPVLTAAQMAQLLRATGSPQTGDTAQRIGPFPNLRAALAGNDSLSAPATLSAAALSGTQAQLTWPAAAGHTRYDLQRRRRTNDVWGGWSTIATPGAGTTVFADSGLAAGGVYVWQIRACDATRCSGWTQSARLTLPAGPAAPAWLLGAPLSASSIRVTWADSIADETRFTLARRERPAAGEWGGWTQIATPAANTTGYTDNGRTPGNTYLYRINACNAAGCSVWVTSPPVNAPNPAAAPNTVRATALSTTRARVAWVDASGNETRFELARRPQNPDGSWGAWTPRGTAAANATAAADSGLASGKRYQYQVRACNGPACSAWVASPGLLMPAVPAVPTALRSTSAAATGVGLAWTDASANETSFTLQRRLRNPDGTYGPWQTIATPARNAVAYTDGGVAAGARYQYRISACDGPVCSGWSNAASVTVP